MGVYPIVPSTMPPTTPPDSQGSFTSSKDKRKDSPYSPSTLPPPKSQRTTTLPSRRPIMNPWVKPPEPLHGPEDHPFFNMFAPPPPTIKRLRRNSFPETTLPPAPAPVALPIIVKHVKTNEHQDAKIHCSLETGRGASEEQGWMRKTWYVEVG